MLRKPRYAVSIVSMPGHDLCVMDVIGEARDFDVCGFKPWGSSFSSLSRLSVARRAIHSFICTPIHLHKPE